MQNEVKSDFKLDSKQFAALLGVSVQSLGYLKRNGIPHERKGNKTLFPLLEALAWHAKNIKSSPFRELCKSNDDEELSIDEQLKKKRMEKIELEMAIQRGEYINIDEVDTSMSELVGLLIAQYRQLMRVLPKLLAKKSETQIKKLLDAQFKQNVDDLRRTFEEKNEEYVTGGDKDES